MKRKPPRRRQPSCYVTEAEHSREVLASHAAPKAATEFARFLDAVIKFAALVPVDDALPSDIPCMAGPSPRRWCLGVVDVWWSTDPAGVRWECPLCKKQGIITGVEFLPAPPESPSPGDRLH